MRQNQLFKIIAILAAVMIFTACGTFEIGIENNLTTESGDAATQALDPGPTDEISDPAETETALTPDMSDEQMVTLAVAEHFDQPADQMDITVTEISGIYAYGYLENGYFIAVKQDNAWQFVHGGQTNPYCRDIEAYDFPIDMVPECMDDNNQVVVRSASADADIRDALAAYTGVSREDIDFTIMQDAGEHIMGYSRGGYFLAARVQGQWQIVFAGNGTPYCSMVDIHDFPAYIVPECMDANNNLVYRTDSPDDLSGLQSLECGLGSPGGNQGSVEWLACNIQDALRSRNTAAILGSLEDPFLIGYWLSEGVFYSPEDFLTLLPQLYNFNDPDYTPRLTFTMDRSQFPELDGRPAEGRFGPDVNIVGVIYSEGWGGDGESEALIYLTQNAAGEYKWYSMLIGYLDVPMPIPVEN